MSTEGVEAEDFAEDRRRESAVDVPSDAVVGGVRGRDDVSTSGETSVVWRFFDSVVEGVSLTSVYRQRRDGMRKKGETGLMPSYADVRWQLLCYAGFVLNDRMVG